MPTTQSPARKSPTNVTEEECQQVLDILVSGLGNDGMSPRRTLASSAVAWLAANDVDSRRAAYVLRLLEEDKVIEKVDGSNGRRILRSSIRLEVTPTLSPAIPAIPATPTPLTVARQHEAHTEGHTGLTESNAQAAAFNKRIDELVADNRRLRKDNADLSYELNTVRGELGEATASYSQLCRSVTAAADQLTVAINA